MNGNGRCSLLLSIVSIVGAILMLVMTISGNGSAIFFKNAEATHDSEDLNNTSGCQNDFIYPTDPIVVTYNQLSGLRLPVGNQIESGIQAELTTFVKDACGHVHPALVVIEVRDSNNTTIFLGWQKIEQMQPYSVTEIGMSWNVPQEPGKYEIRAFTLVNLNTSGFGRAATSNIDVVLPER
jgi:hypothetical protein